MAAGASDATLPLGRRSRRAPISVNATTPTRLNHPELRTTACGEAIAEASAMSAPTDMPHGSRRISANAAHEFVVPTRRGVSHAVACGVSIVAAVVVVVLAPAGRASVAVAVYGIALVALFGGSALYHRWSGSARFKAVLQRVDHSVIFVFIAASYTPIAVVLLHGWVGWVLLGLAWLGAGIGIAFSMGWVQAPRVIVAGSYLALGWLAVIVIPQLIADLQLTALILVGGGGVLYSAGAVVYVRQRPNLWPRTFGFHELFHLLVIVAAAAYYVALIGWMLRATTAEGHDPDPGSRHRLHEA